MKLKLSIGLFILLFSLPTLSQTAYDPTQDVRAIKAWHDKSRSLRSGTFVTVGEVGDQFCDYNSIQEALDDVELNIRVTYGSTFTENILLDTSNTTIRGGYLTCEDAMMDNQDSNQTIISGANGTNQPVMTIDIISDAEITVYLENIQLTGSVASGGLSGAGLAILSDDINVGLNRVTIDNNTALEMGINEGSGGGIAMLNTDIDLDLIDTIIQNNQANQGGGIYCEGSGNTIRISGNSAVRMNSARGLNANGGGIHSVLCQLTVYSGNDDLTLGIDSNTAARNGGGVYLAASNATFYGHEACADGFCIGNNDEPVNISRNQKILDIGQQNGNGGGLYANASNVNMYGVLVQGNSTEEGNAGGLFLRGTEFNVERIQSACWDDIRCNAFINNSAGGENFTGGAFSLSAPTNITTRAFIRQSYFSGNSADGGTVISASGNAQQIIELELTQSILESNNGARADFSIFNFSRDITALMIHNTVVDNRPTGSIISNPTNLSSIVIGASIITDDNGINITNSSNNISASCNIFHETLSIIGLNNELAQANLFTDSDYNLTSDSQAIDFCNDRLGLLDARDINNDVLGFDDPTQMNFLGPYDAGAQEAVLSDIIFEDGFE